MKWCIPILLVGRNINCFVHRSDLGGCTVVEGQFVRPVRGRCCAVAFAVTSS